MYVKPVGSRIWQALKSATRAVERGVTKAQHWVLDIKPGDPPCFVAGMGLGGDLTRSFSILDTNRELLERAEECFNARENQKACKLLDEINNDLDRFGLEEKLSRPDDYNEEEWQLVYDLGEVRKEAGILLARLGKIDLALSYGRKANKDFGPPILAEVAITIAREGAIDKAEALIPELHYDWDDVISPVETEIACTLTQRGETGKALEIIRDHHPRQKETGLSRIALILLQLGKKAEALKAAEEAFKLEKSIRFFHDAEDVERILAAFRQLGEAEKASEAAELFDLLSAEPESLPEKLKDIAKTIMITLAGRLGIKIDPVVRGGAAGSYGGIGLGMGLMPVMETRIELRQEFLPGDVLAIEAGTTIEEIRERMVALNFLVPHETAHLIQQRRRIPRPAIRSSAMLDQAKVGHHANETMLDKLALEAATKIYVHRKEGNPLEAAERERICIEAYLTLSKIVIRNLENGVHDLSAENLARFVAVSLEMAGSRAIDEMTSLELQGTAAVFMDRIIGSNPMRVIERFHGLIDKYRRIFQKTRLII